MGNGQSECSTGRVKQRSAPRPRLSNVRVSREKPGPGFELNVRLQESTPSSSHTHTHTELTMTPADQPLSSSLRVSPCQSQTVSWPQNRDDDKRRALLAVFALNGGNNESDTFLLSCPAKHFSSSHIISILCRSLSAPYRNL